MIDLARLRRSAAEWEKYEEGEDFPLAPAHADFEDPLSDGHGPSRHVAELVVVRDPFATRTRSTLIYNWAFGPLNRVGPIPKNELGRLPEDKLTGLARHSFSCVGLTEFEVKSRCLPFDAHAWDVFRKGGQILWVWDQEQALSHGGQHDTQILKRLKTALAARMLLAEIFIGEMRDKMHPRKTRIDIRTNKAYFREEYREKVMGFESGNQVDYYDKPQQALLSFYGFSSKDIRRNMQSERDFFGYLYRGKSQTARSPNLDFVKDREFAILKALRNGVLLAEAIHAAKSDIRKRGAEAETDHRPRLDRYDLDYIDYFAIALYSGVNPECLHSGLSRVATYLDATVWLGQLGRASHLELVPEICKALHEIMTDQTLPGPLGDTLRPIFNWLRGRIDIITRSQDLSIAVDNTLAGKQPPVIERKAYGRLARRGRGKSKDSRLSEDTGLVEFVDRDWTRAVYNCNNRPKRGYELDCLITPNREIPGATGEDIVIHPFIPWAW